MIVDADRFSINAALDGVKVIYTYSRYMHYLRQTTGTTAYLLWRKRLLLLVDCCL